MSTEAIIKDFKRHSLSAQFKLLLDSLAGQLSDLAHDWYGQDRVSYQRKEFQFIDSEKLRRFRAVHMQVRMECPSYKGVVHK